MTEQTTIFLSTVVAIILMVYTLAVLANTSRYVLGSIRKGMLLQLFGLLMVAFGFLWGAFHILLEWSNGRVVTQLLLFTGIMLMFFATRHLFRMEKPEGELPSRIIPHVVPETHI